MTFHSKRVSGLRSTENAAFAHDRREMMSSTSGLLPSPFRLHLIVVIPVQ